MKIFLAFYSEDNQIKFIVNRTVDSALDTFFLPFETLIKEISNSFFYFLSSFAIVFSEICTREKPFQGLSLTNEDTVNLIAGRTTPQTIRVCTYFIYI